MAEAVYVSFILSQRVVKAVSESVECLSPLSGILAFRLRDGAGFFMNLIQNLF